MDINKNKERSKSRRTNLLSGSVNGDRTNMNSGREKAKSNIKKMRQCGRQNKTKPLHRNNSRQEMKNDENTKQKRK